MSFSDRVLGFGAFPNRDTTYDIDQSVVFSGSQYFHRTPGSASNQRTWTWSGWVKRGNITDGFQVLWSAYDDSTTNDSHYFNVGFTASDTLSVNSWSSNWRITNRVFRDPSAWYHVVVVLDTTDSTANDRVKVYINGVQETSFGTFNNPDEDEELGINKAQQHRLGATNYSTGSGPYYYKGYMAEVHFIDGTAVAASAFGETDSDTGEWVPKAYNTSSGAYGTNGFYLKFVEGAEGTDSSGEGNNYTAVDGSSNDIDEKVMLDTPTNNFPVINPLFPNLTTSPSTSEGNLVLSGRASTYTTAVGTIAVSYTHLTLPTTPYV